MREVSRISKSTTEELKGEHLSFIDPPLGGFGKILPSAMIIAEGNILPNPPSGGSINDILYRKICHRKNSTTWTLWLNYLIKTACNRKRNVHDQSYLRLKNPISQVHIYKLSNCYFWTLVLIVQPLNVVFEDIRRC